MIGTSIEHYRIDALIGRGGMGEVYRAFDTKLDRPVAIKVLGANDRDRRFLVERFVREARAASSLNHPHIVTIHDAGQSSAGQYFIVQELVDGDTLRALLAPRLPFDRALSLAAQLARALSAAHAAGIVHRDLKPETSWCEGTATSRCLISASPGRSVPRATAMPPRTPEKTQRLARSSARRPTCRRNRPPRSQSGRRRTSSRSA